MSTEPTIKRLRELRDILHNGDERDGDTENEMRDAIDELLRLRALPREPAEGEFGRTDLPQVMVYTAQLAESRLDRPNMLSGYHQMVMFADHQRALDKAIASLDTSRERGEVQKEILREVRNAYSTGYRAGQSVGVQYEQESLYAHSESRAIAYVDAREDRLRALSAPAAAPVEMDAWVPIATAPKGGGAEMVTDPAWVDPPEILLLFPSAKKAAAAQAVGVWDWHYAPGGGGHAGVSAWICPASGDLLAMYYGEPTHWQPLPDAAIAAAGEGA